MPDFVIQPIILLLMILFVYFFFVRKPYNYYMLRKNGFKVPAKVTSIRETNSFEGDGTFSVPIMEISFELEGQEIAKKPEIIKYAFRRWQNIPKVGDTIIILVDKRNPRNFKVSNESFR